mgnify:CR=1 FL=1
MKKIPNSLLKKVVGKTVDEAKGLCVASGCLMRDANKVGTCDARPNRINVNIENGIVVSVSHVG